MRITYLFLSGLLLFFGLSCQKNYDNSAIQPKYPFYFTATINDSSVKYEANDIDSRYRSVISSASHSNNLGAWDQFEGTLIQDSQNDSADKIYVYILQRFPGEPGADERQGMFRMGTYVYGSSNINDTTINGAIVRYTDNRGTYWSTENGPQTNSAFEIVEISNNTDLIPGKIIKANFNCKLYSDAGDSMQVYNATIRGKILFQ